MLLPDKKDRIQNAWYRGMAMQTPTYPSPTVSFGIIEPDLLMKSMLFTGKKPVYKK